MVQANKHQDFPSQDFALFADWQAGQAELWKILSKPRHHYVIIAPVQIKDGYKEQFVAGTMENASGAVHDEFGCLRFDVIQYANDKNRIWV